ncbi:MAG: hypothetical protein ACXVDN_02530 [Ktedonobacteraceae bacterium]
METTLARLLLRSHPIWKECARQFLPVLTTLLRSYRFAVIQLEGLR